MHIQSFHGRGRSPAPKPTPQNHKHVTVQNDHNRYSHCQSGSDSSCSAYLSFDVGKLRENKWPVEGQFSHVVVVKSWGHDLERRQHNQRSHMTAYLHSLSPRMRDCLHLIARPKQGSTCCLNGRLHIGTMDMPDGCGCYTPGRKAKFKIIQYNGIIPDKGNHASSAVCPTSKETKNKNINQRNDIPAKWVPLKHLSWFNVVLLEALLTCHRNCSP